jgi:hypothetical protein
MELVFESETIKNLLIPMSDGVTLAADVYRPKVEDPVPAIIMFCPYHKDDTYGPGSWEGPMRSMAQMGYACLLIDVRGTGSSGGFTISPFTDREVLDYYEAVEWVAGTEWCDGHVGLWGKSYGSIAALLTAVQNPPHLGAVVNFHGVATNKWWDLIYVGGRLRLMETFAQFGPRMTCDNFMPPAYRDEDGRWLSVWEEHLESNLPWVVSAFDVAVSQPQGPPEPSIDLGQIKAPVYLWSGWRDVFPKQMVEAYQALKSPKKITVGPYMHVLPDDGHAGRIDYLYEVKRWFDHWLLDKDAGIMDEPPVAVYVQGAETWVYEDDFPPPQCEPRELYLGGEGSLSENASDGASGGTDSFPYDATAGVYSDIRAPQGLVIDQRPDELKGVIYTTPPLEEDMEICGAPEAMLHYESTASETLLVVKINDVAPDGRSTIITWGALDAGGSGKETPYWGEASKSNPSMLLNLIPTAYVIPSGHRLRVFISGANFPHQSPSFGPGDISVRWGGEAGSSVMIPVRPVRGDAPKPAFGIPREIPRTGASAPQWTIEQRPVERSITVRIGSSVSLGIDGGEGPATVRYTHKSTVTAKQEQPSQPSAYGESWGCWENEREKIEVQTVSALRAEGLDVSVMITLNGAPYWQKRWSRVWPEE